MTEVNLVSARETLYTPRDPAVVSKNMRAVRNRGNVADRLLGSELWKRGHRYRRYRDLPGKPDLAFAGAGLAVFVDGDFWHGRVLVELGADALKDSLKTAKRDWWVAKIGQSVTHDRRVDDALADLGWRVCRVWEHDVLRDPSGSADQVCAQLHPSSEDAPPVDRRTHSGSSKPGLDRRSPKRLANR